MVQKLGFSGNNLVRIADNQAWGEGKKSSGPPDSWDYKSVSSLDQNSEIATGGIQVENTAGMAHIIVHRDDSINMGGYLDIAD